MRRALMLTLGILVLGFGVVQAKSESKAKMVAWANLKSTTEGGIVNGEIRFFEIPGGLKIVGNISDAPPGKHGIHIHDIGNCADAGNAAGGHYNPHGTPHGFLPKDSVVKAHAGDMGNVTIDKSGHGDFSVKMIGISVHDHNPVDGRAVILHEKVDDFGQPTGNAGGRIACGIIETDNDHMGTEADTTGHEDDHAPEAVK